ncbi:MAG TPA: hypothetical protein VIJ79_18235, partial [Acidobacteriaceae bacterium]
SWWGCSIAATRSSGGSCEPNRGKRLRDAHLSRKKRGEDGSPRGFELVSTGTGGIRHTYMSLTRCAL